MLRAWGVQELDAVTDRVDPDVVGVRDAAGAGDAAWTVKNPTMHSYRRRPVRYAAAFFGRPPSCPLRRAAAALAGVRALPPA